jgi:PEP-CTERM motif
MSLNIISARSAPIAFCPGAGNLASTVPEPPTWAMMLLGFAGLGFAGYQASRKSGALAA